VLGSDKQNKIIGKNNNNQKQLTHFDLGIYIQPRKMASRVFFHRAERERDTQ
jgi:hypothetical protein